MLAEDLSVVPIEPEITMLDHALSAARRGLRVHPLHRPTVTSENPAKAECSCGRLECGKKNGKHPVDTGWKIYATSDESEIKSLWRRHPNANVGVHAEGLMVADFDVHERDGRGVMARS